MIRGAAPLLRRALRLHASFPASAVRGANGWAIPRRSGSREGWNTQCIVLRMTGRALLPLLLLAAACSAEVTGREGAATRVSQPIVNGTPSTAADDSVVFISMNGSNDDFCTGTLITPNLVLTARHCVSAMDESTECGTFTTQSPPSTFSISIGVTPGARVATAKALFVDSAMSASGCSNDIALFQLDKDLPTAKLSPVRFTKLTVGEAARTAGYGDDGSGAVTKGRYVKTGIKVDSVGPGSYTYKTATGTSIPVNVPPGEIVTGESTCFGDSGGPLFDGSGNVIGVTSRGVDGECKDRPSIYSDTASHAKLITDAAATAGHPLSATGTPTPRPDGDKTKPRDDDDDDDDDVDDDSDEPAPKPKKKKTPAPAASTGCSSAPGSLSGSSFPVLAGLALLVAIARRRRH
jgi:MYXO-CTERM domain-containing protein